MSVVHFQSLQQMIQLLEVHGYKDATDEVKPLCDNYFIKEVLRVSVRTDRREKQV